MSLNSSYIYYRLFHNRDLSLNSNFTLSIFLKVALKLKLKSSLIFSIRVELEPEKSSLPAQIQNFLNEMSLSLGMFGSVRLVSLPLRISSRVFESSYSRACLQTDLQYIFANICLFRKHAHEQNLDF